MTRIITVALGLILCTALTCSAATITYKAGPTMGPVSFDHDTHKTDYAKTEGCGICHTGTPAKIDAFGKGKAAAHAICYDCHKQKEINECVICHK